MDLPENTLKTRLLTGEVQLGLWLGLGAATTAEISAAAGFDWCLIDAEHNPNSDAMILDQLRAMNGQGAAPVVRVTAGEDWMLKRVLDLGVQSVLVPMVDTAADAAAMVRAVRYPPGGRRGMGAVQARATAYGMVQGYATAANDQVCLMVQVESRAAIENIDAIAATEGVDVVFIGPADLSADMGYPGQPDAPEVVAAIEHAATRIKAAGKALGTITFDTGTIAYWRDLGATFLAVGGDVHIFANAVRGRAAEARTILSGE